MLKRLLSRRAEKANVGTSVNGRKYSIASPGSDLLAASPSRQAKIAAIKKSYSVTAEAWDAHYLFAITQFADYVQDLPASNSHHHSIGGGLLDHTLETLLAGSRASLQYMLPPNSEPELIASHGDRWRFAVFVALLSHDLGKIVTDIEVVYRQSDRYDFVTWHPWSGPLPLGCEYAYRFRPRAENAGVAKSLHEKTAISLVPNLLTDKARRWIWSDTELLAQFLCTVNHAAFGGGVLAEIVRKADQSSVVGNLGPTTGVATSHASETPLQEKLILALRQMILDGDLRSNKPGAAAWITDTHTWLVFKNGGEALRDRLLSEGHKSVPRSVMRIANVLLDHGIVMPNPDGEAAWQARIEDHERQWFQKLSFMRFHNSLLWATGDPRYFSGDVIPLDTKGSPLDAEQEVVEQPITVLESEPTAFPEPEPSTEQDSASPRLPDSEPNTAPASEADKADHTGADVAKTRKITPAKSPFDLFKPPKPPTDAIQHHDFFRWLVKNAESRVVRVNEPEATVHVMDKYVAVVSPLIFITYLRKNKMQAKAYKQRSVTAEPFKLLQREIIALNLHQNIKGQPITKLNITGTKKQTYINCILIHKRHIPFFKKFKPNAAVSFPD